MRQIMSAAAVLLAGVAAAEAAPLPGKATAPAAAPMVELAQAWRYHRNCGWRGGRWIIDLGAGRIVACRPNRPRGADWHWRSEGPRHGWYHRRDRRWHFDRW